MHYIALFAFGLAASVSARWSPVKRQAYTSGDSSTDVTLPCDPNDGECQDAEESYLQDVCYPVNSTQQPDLSTPCWQNYALIFECSFGEPGLELALNTSNSYGVPDGYAQLSNATQRDCICQSQFFAATEGCNDCFAKHGGSEVDGGGVAPSSISSFSASYCAITNTPTANIADALYAIVTATTDESVSLTSTFSDPLHNSTAVSLYYTPSITGPVWSVAEATVTPSNSTDSGSATASVHTSNGQIVATSLGTSSSSGASASAASSAASSSRTTASSSSSAGAAQETAAVAGVIALAGIVALL